MNEKKRFDHYEKEQVRLVQSRQSVWLVGVIISIISCLALSSGASYFSINIPDISFSNWEDDGSIEKVVSTCVDSVDKGKAKKYGFSIAEAFLYLGGDTNEAGNKRIPISFEHRSRDADNKKASKRSWKSWSNVSSGSFNDGHDKGSKAGCIYESSNLEIKAQIDGTDLQSTYGGDYSHSFSVTGTNEKGLTDTDTFAVSLSVIANNYVKITGMDAVSLTTNLLAVQQADEGFCVYSTAGGYTINIASTYTTDEQFALNGTSGEGLVPVSVQFADNTTGSGMVTVTPSSGPQTGSGNSVSETCSASNNAMLRFVISSDAIASALTGNYITQLTLTVSPL